MNNSDDSVAAPDAATNHIDGGGRCTEAFYREKVKQVSDLHVKDESNVSQMRDILTRTFYNGNDDDYDDNDRNDARSKTIENNDLSLLTDEDLEALAACGLSLGGNGGDDGEVDQDDEGLLQSIPLYLKERFEQAVQRGELSHLVDKFRPFWLPNYHCNSQTELMEEVNSDDDRVVRNEAIISAQNTLDERILCIPPLHLPHTQLDSTPRVSLQYNICEVMYVAAWTMRLYNTDTVPLFKVGSRITDPCLEDMGLCTEMAFFLYTKSRVLSDDARFQSAVEVFMECSARTNEEMKHSPQRQKDSSSFACLNSKILINDLMHICKFRRVALRVLLVAGDMLDRARRHLKKEVGGIVDKNDTSEVKQKKKQLMLGKKKMEYLSSWCNTYWDSCCGEIVEDIERWQHDWDERHIASDNKAPNIFIE